MNLKNKGFTLVELLAAITLLGILMGIGLPMFTNMISNSRRKIYVSDAQNLISKAEYEVKANTSEVEKPDPGECIVLSLNYLYDSSFDSPPYEGVYNKDASFVVVKNINNGQLEYSVMLVETMKGGNTNYQGIKLTKESILKNSSPSRVVSSIKTNELYYVGDHVNPSFQKLTKAYINTQLGTNYVSDIMEVYA